MPGTRTVSKVTKMTFLTVCLFSVSILIVEVIDENLIFKSMVRYSLGFNDTTIKVSEQLTRMMSEPEAQLYSVSMRMAPPELHDDTIRNVPVIFANGSTSIPIKEHMKGLDFRDSYIHSVNGKTFIITKKLARYRNHTNVGQGHYYIYSVIANINVVYPSSFSFVLSGWGREGTWETPYQCCFLHYNGNITSRVTSTKRRIDFGKDVIYSANQIVCPYTGSGTFKENPIAIGLVLTNETCGHDVIYEEPTYSLVDVAPRFGIIGKIAYGSKNPNQLIEWVEWNRYFGASKMLVYPYYDLNSEAMRVLEYYNQEGIFEMVPLAPVPLLKNMKRYFGGGHYVMYQDEQVIDNDGQERLAPYTYFALIDTDEFLLPEIKYKSYTEMMEGLLKKHPSGGSFMMKTEVHVFDWGRSNPLDPLMISRYSNHTPAMYNCPKFMSVSDRVQPGTSWIHSTQTKEGYKTFYLDDESVVIKHFRKCRNEWIKKEGNETKTKCDTFERIHDVRMGEIASEIKDNVIAVRRKLGIEY